MSYQGDVMLGATLDFTFSSRTIAGPASLLNGLLATYKGANGNFEAQLTADFGGKTGLNRVVIDTSTAFFEREHDYSIVLETGTVGGVSVAGEVVATFSIENRTITMPVGVWRLDVHLDATASVPGASIVVMSDAGDVLDRRLSDESGDAAFFLDDGDYAIRVYDPAHAAFDQTLVTIDGEDDAITITGTPFSPSSDPLSARLYSWEYEADGITPIEGAEVSAYPFEQDAHTTAGGVGDKRTRKRATTDATGFWFVDIAPGVEYQIDCLATRGIVHHVTTPAVGTATQLESLL